MMTPPGLSENVGTIINTPQSGTQPGPDLSPIRSIGAWRSGYVS